MSWEWYNLWLLHHGALPAFVAGLIMVAPWISILSLPIASVPALPVAPVVTDSPAAKECREVVTLLVEGKQSESEDRLKKSILMYSNHEPLLFLNAACARSRFQVEDAAPLFFNVMQRAPRSPEGLAAALS